MCTRHRDNTSHQNVGQTTTQSTSGDGGGDNREAHSNPQH
eukprot:CAMPEP_0183552066 /NCGR_PEP_ID=MMETSP0371-20130417/70809_1 /TAXON_ID=268820 /ORGANISM="Peridinium aciculiferum, Strain PAER-2" /LENGTH=39 /DNA_ID= /DNA_START= /DNA_END= /DNA_ORIENTATION=